MRRAETSITGRSLHQASTTTSAETWDTTGSSASAALEDAVEAWKDMAGNQSKHKSHGKIVLRVA